MGKKGHSELMLLLFTMAVLCLEAKIHKTVYISFQKLTWDEARKHCQENYIDMVTWDVVNPELLNELLKEEDDSNFWIGLHEDPEQLLFWSWINVKTGIGLTGDRVNDSESWHLTLQSSGSCGSYNSRTKKLESELCTKQLPFICFGDNLIIVDEKKTWEDALNHCRKKITVSSKSDLLSITNPTDYYYVTDRIYRATTEEVWTGLRFLGGEWWWSDGETLDHQETLPGCPSQWQHCGTLSKNNKGFWITRDCSERRNFICYYEKVAEQKEYV
ncbi:macrophage mannose receptor 1-like [Cyprinodon tularosa]|uniref:macrophage mannose receptor 1-like n=1 Tax=Cyprinodon tularosa TaxID=77115 RepID=UPI0018E26A47|nr:macrophage mannose receptor 1-like [Cyprinodon tularosa]